MSELFGQRLRDAPSDAEITSHKLLVRGGFVRLVAAGVYAWLPLGFRVLKRVEQIVREEMDRAGAVELLMPLLQPGELWQKSGRWDSYGPVLYRLKDRSERDLCLAPTHEEMIAFLASTELPSYRDLPITLYHIQWKFRDEPRARGGLLRAREFYMKDAYSFDVDEAGLMVSYKKMEAAYHAAFPRLGLSPVQIEADPGAIGGTVNHEFTQVCSSGEDTFVACDMCDYAANTEVASGRPVCDRCGGTLRIERGIEVGHIFQLVGASYLERLGATFTAPDGTEKQFVMGCYGLGVSRAVAAIVETHNDERGITWPRSTAPFQMSVIALAKGVGIDALVDGLDALIDDREGVTAGVKFAEADLIGCPLQIVIGKTFTESGKLEAKIRATGERFEIDPSPEAIAAALERCP